MGQPLRESQEQTAMQPSYHIEPKKGQKHETIDNVVHTWSVYEHYDNATLYMYPAP